MIIKKFVDKDSRSAMARVRDEFGAEAVVLSSRSVGDSFEMIAAANYDEYDVLRQCDDLPQEEFASGPAAVVRLPSAPAPQIPVEEEVAKTPAANEPAKKSASNSAKDSDNGPSLQTLQTELASLRELIQKELPKYSSGPSRAPNPARAAIKSRLARLGVSKDLSLELINEIPDLLSQKESWQSLVKLMTGKLKQNEETLLETGGIAAFIGPVGSGKTSTVAKIASAHLMTHGRGELGLITTSGVGDAPNTRLIKFANAMGIPCIEANTATHLKAAVEEFSDKKLVLIDTPGMERNDLRLTMQLAEFRLTNHPIDSYLVVSAESDGTTLEKTINAFSRYKPVGLVVTKVDKSLNLGGIIETLVRRREGLSYISDGTRIPGDLYAGGAKIIMKRALSLLNGLEDSDKRSSKQKTQRRRSATSKNLRRVAGQ